MFALMLCDDREGGPAGGYWKAGMGPNILGLLFLDFFSQHAWGVIITQ